MKTETRVILLVVGLLVYAGLIVAFPFSFRNSPLSVLVVTLWYFMTRWALPRPAGRSLWRGPIRQQLPLPVRLLLGTAVVIGIFYFAHMAIGGYYSVLAQATKGIE